MEDKVVGFKSSTLTKKDVQLFNRGGWLSDQCINFYYEHLDDKFRNRCLFMDPATVFLIQCTKDVSELKNSLGALNLSKDVFIFCPVNDSTDPVACKGSHWTLLIYAGPHSCLYYYDSSGCLPTNKHNALNIGTKLAKIIDQKITKLYQVTLINPQTNGNDCGIFVLLLSQFIAREIHRGKDREATHLVGLQEWICPNSAHQMRKYIIKLINSKTLYC